MAAVYTHTRHWLLVGLARPDVRAWTELLAAKHFAVLRAETLASTRELLGANASARLHGAIVEERLADGSGLQLIELLGARRPSVPVVFVSRNVHFDRA